MKSRYSIPGQAIPAFLSLLLVQPLAAQATFTTANGTGADTFLANDSNIAPTSARGTNTVLTMRRFAGTRSRQPLFRFDVSSLPVAANRTGATLSLTITRSANRTRTANVYGLVDETLDTWDEATTSYSTAPGAIATTLGNHSYSIFDETTNPSGKYKLLGTMSFPASASTTPIVSIPASLNLDNFLATDTNGLVTFLIIPQASDTTADWDIASKENTTSTPPRLNLPNVIFDSDADGLLDSWEILYFSEWPTPGQVDPLRFIGTEDPDGDGVDNLTEQSIGSDPTIAAASLVWQGGQGGDAWDNGLTSNWLNGPSASIFSTGDLVSFTDVGSANSVVSLVSNIKPFSLVVNSTADYSFTGSGTLSGPTGLTKSGTGNLTISTTNSYTGSTIVNAGTLTLGAAGAVPGTASSGSFTLAGGTVYLNGFSATFKEFSGAGGIVDSNNGLAQTLTLSNPSDSTYSGSFQNTAGSLTLVKGGLGILTLSGTSTHSGGTFIGINGNGTRVGTIRATSSQALGTGAVTIGLGGNDASATLEVGGGVILANALTLPARNNASFILRNVSGSNSITGAFTLTTGGTQYSIESAAGLLTLGSTGNPLIAFSPNSAIRDFNLSGAGDGIIAGDLNFINGSLAMRIIKSGAGKWTIAGNLAFTGDTTVSDGILEVATDDVFDNTSTVTLASNSSLSLTHSGIDTVSALVIAGIPQLNGLYTFGTGQLNVDSSFKDWAILKGLDGTAGKERGLGDNPDRDSANNLVEFAFNGNPLSGSDNGIIRQFNADSSDVGSDAELVLTIAVRSGTPAFTGAPSPTATHDGVTYTIQGSTDLVGFAVGVTPVDPLTPGLPDLTGSGYEYRSFSLDGSNGLPAKGFLRAMVVSP